MHVDDVLTIQGIKPMYTPLHTLLSVILVDSQILTRRKLTVTP